MPHGKIFSILYSNDAEQLVPFYDLMSTAVYFDIHKAKMAMKLGGRYKFKEIGLRHFERLGEAIEFRGDFVKKQVCLLAKKIFRPQRYYLASLITPLECVVKLI